MLICESPIKRTGLQRLGWRYIRAHLRDFGDKPTRYAGAHRRTGSFDRTSREQAFEQTVNPLCHAARRCATSISALVLRPKMLISTSAMVGDSTRSTTAR